MWTHKKLKGEFKASAMKFESNRLFAGKYVFYFIVNKKRRDYSSWQAAKRDGWIKGN